MRWRAGSNRRRLSALQPPPGPPWRNSAGRPSGLPHTSQYTSWPSPTDSRPWSYGSIGGYNVRRSDTSANLDELLQAPKPRRVALAFVAIAPVRVRDLADVDVAARVDREPVWCDEMAQLEPPGA